MLPHVYHSFRNSLTNTDCTAMVPHITVTASEYIGSYPNPAPHIPTFIPKPLVYMWSGNGCDWTSGINGGPQSVRNFKTDRDGAYTQCSNLCQLYGTTPKPLPFHFFSNAVLMKLGEYCEIFFILHSVKDVWTCKM
jgi:hypothetical protein